MPRRNLAGDRSAIEHDIDPVLVVAADEHERARLDPQRRFADREARRAAGRHEPHRVARARADRRPTHDAGSRPRRPPRAHKPRRSTGAIPETRPASASSRRAIELGEHPALDARPPGIAQRLDVDFDVIEIEARLAHDDLLLSSPAGASRRARGTRRARDRPWRISDVQARAPEARLRRDDGRVHEVAASEMVRSSIAQSVNARRCFGSSRSSVS